ncbi:MAG: hypothetical protein Q7T24_07100, partial [Deltaproteobacteria bacterium]|nr:hypothetical protein [Deltaproteobacteria bacterium]
MKNSVLYAIFLSALLAVFSSGAVFTGNAIAGEAGKDAQKISQKAVKQTQQAIDNLKAAIKEFEKAQKTAGEDEHLREAVNNARAALDSAEKS